MLIKASTVAGALLALVCSINLVLLQVSDAFQFKPCDRTFGMLLSLKINQCPDTKGDCCQFNPLKPLVYEMTFESGVEFETAYTSVQLGSQNRYTFESCKRGFTCPGKEADLLIDRNNLGKLTDFNGTTGNATIRVRNENLESMMCIQFPLCALRNVS